MIAKRLALRGDLLDFSAAPSLTDTSMKTVRFRPDHWLLIHGGRIVGAQPGSQLPDPSWWREDHSGRLIMPGFIDTHVHSPQLDVIGSYGAQLLDWLNNYTFPAELAYADPELAEAGSHRFLDALISHGTTTALIYPTVHKLSADRLFAAAHARNMRIVTGKVMMDRHAPRELCDRQPDSERDCRELIERWHGKGRNAYAVTVRFAPTSTPEQIAVAARLLKEDPSLYMQTHVAENRNEVRWVGELFPEARSYLDVYLRGGLLHERSVLGHAIWLDANDRAALHETGAVIAHCPSSNLFLGSGLFDWQAMASAHAAVSLASDVGGGTSLSMLRTMADAYRVQALRGVRLSAFKALHTATLGAARALRLEREIGRLEPGCLADITLWDWAVGPVATARDALARDLHERLFAWMMLGDERNLVTTLVAGRTQYKRRSDASGASETTHGAPTAA